MVMEVHRKWKKHKKHTVFQAKIIQYEKIEGKRFFQRH
ncbi:Hypothetical protein Ccan_07850 [Capnocytophaga canimorsus Cc5]|uniref:Uncharacterized protein n=1 Tax=Capnocytophaga canimorsus (strain 5) TaxID=860228 RepID=F9YTW9_CAPCC|nr:Hypothetical protein Ccan_07850 [Capnocytophaga canimorsus Cc5]